MPVVVLPQLLLCGLFHPRAEMATVLRWASDVLPLSYAVDALQRVTTSRSLSSTYWHDVLVVLGCALAGLTLAAATLPRRTD
jgi:ABC-2 type transport system permease protein